jgi:hypothetical protein
VEDICTSLSIPLENEKSCIGFAVDDELNLCRRESGDRHCKIKVNKQGLSLADAEFKSRHFPTGLNKEQCLCLAANLASSVLQFHGTPWLPESWCDKSIYFSHPVSVDRPYLGVSLQDAPSLHVNQSIFKVNPFLVGLGIILLELSVNMSFQEWRTRNKSTDDTTDMASLGRAWLREISSRKGVSDEYALVVQRCLTSAFGTYTPTLELADSGFREIVYREILLPLEAEYIAVKEPLKIVSEGWDSIN